MEANSKKRQKGAAVPPASDAAIRGAISGWQPPATLIAEQMFQRTSSIASLNSVLGAAFSDPDKSQLFVRSLRGSDQLRMATVPTLIGSSLAAQVARPSIAGLDREPLFAKSGLGRQLATIGKNLAVITEAIRGPQMQMTKMLESARIGVASWQPHLERFGEVMREFAEEQRQLDVETDVFVARHGWPVPTSLPLRAYKQVVSKSRSGKRDVNAFMVNSFRPGTRAYTVVREVIDESPDFESRRPLLRQVYSAQRNGHWYLVINGLLPLVEGVLIDAVFPSGKRPKSVKPGMDQLSETERGYGDAGFRALETMIVGAGSGVALFESYSPPPGVEPRSLNRHGVLHGSARRYGTEQNAAKLFLMLVLLAECLEIRRTLVEREQ